MDPQAALDSMKEDIDRGWLPEADLTAGNLLDWIDRSGFKPPPSEIRLVQGMIADTGEPLDELPFLDRFMELES